jgi:hypothetical protein
MHRTIDLNAELGRSAIEVEDIRTNRMLPAEVQPELVAAQQRPQHTLRLGHGAAQRPGAFTYEIR